MFEKVGQHRVDPRKGEPDWGPLLPVHWLLVCGHEQEGAQGDVIRRRDFDVQVVRQKSRCQCRVGCRMLNRNFGQRGPNSWG